jgi:hypothetical protein
MPISLVGSVMNMTADILVQQNNQSATSGVITREWVYEETIRCNISPIKSGGASSRGDGKRFNVGKNNEYEEILELKMKCLVPVSKRWRISGIKSSDGHQVYTEIDRYDNPDTIFEIVGSHAVLDPFGKVSHYEITLKRVRVQNDNTESK